MSPAHSQKERGKTMTNVRKKKRYRLKKGLRFTLIRMGLLLIIILIIAGLVFGLTGGRSPEKKPAYLESLSAPSWVDRQILEEDGHSRNGRDLEAVNDIVIHYVANPGSTAQQNHDYYASSSSKVSSHYIVGLEGEIIQCLPLDEYSACTNERNRDTISIEVCHPDEGGKFNDKTYASVIKLTAWLCDKADLDTDHVIRHHDVTGKICPKYYVENPEAWEALLDDVKKAM